MNFCIQYAFDIVIFGCNLLFFLVFIIVYYNMSSFPQKKMEYMFIEQLVFALRANIQFAHENWSCTYVKKMIKRWKYFEEKREKESNEM